MNSYNVAEAKAKLSALIERAIAGEEIQITKRGRPAVRLVAVEQPRKPIDVDALRALRARMKPYEDRDGLSFVERMRRDDRY